MVLFELAQNAAKYGALASQKGRVELSWHVEQHSEPVLDFLWRERDGPPVEPPQDEGFGTNFIRRSLAYEMGGSAEISYDPSGIECRLRLPLGTREGGRDDI